MNVDKVTNIREEITVRHPLIEYHRSIIMTKPGINVTLKTTRILDENKVFVPDHCNMYISTIKISKVYLEFSSV